MFQRIARAVFAAALLLLGAAAQAQFPNKAVKIIVPYPAGQATDIAARIVGDALSKEWGQAVVIENIGGGAAIPGLVTARGAAPDGYTLLMGTSAAMVVNPAIMEKLPYDPFNDFILIGPVFRNPLIIVANDKAPYKTLKDLVDAAKKDPGKLTMASPGAGTTNHLVCRFGAGGDYDNFGFGGISADKRYGVLNAAFVTSRRDLARWHSL